MRYLLFILIVVSSCPAYGWEHDDCRDRSYRYDRHGDAPVDKYQYDSDSVYNWKYKYDTFEKERPRRDYRKDHRRHYDDSLEHTYHLGKDKHRKENKWDSQSKRNGHTRD